MKINMDGNKINTLSLRDIVNDPSLRGIVNDPSLRGIVNGQRTQVIDTTIAPYASVVHMPMEGGMQPAASGSVVGKNTILTSAHVAECMSSGMRVTPAMNNGIAPYGTFCVKSIDIPPEWVTPTGRDLTYDYAVVTVEKNADGLSIGDVVPQLKIKRTNVEDLKLGSYVNLIGYPGDKGSEQMWECPGELVRDDGKFYCMNDVFGWEYHFLAFNSDAVMGNSGGPILNSDNEIIGVLNVLSEGLPDLCNIEEEGNGAPMMWDAAIDWITGKLS